MQFSNTSYKLLPVASFILSSLIGFGEEKKHLAEKDETVSFPQLIVPEAKKYRNFYFIVARGAFWEFLIIIV